MAQPKSVVIDKSSGENHEQKRKQSTNHINILDEVENT